MGVDFLLRNAKKIVMFAAIMALIAVTVSLAISTIEGLAAQALNSIGAGYVAFLTPSNLGTCLSIVIAAKLAGTVYEAAMQLIKWKVDILA